MHVARFTGEYSLVAPLYGVSPSDLAAMDSRRPQPVSRWFAATNGHAAGAVIAWRRPDDRTFLLFRVAEAAAYGPLLDAVRADLTDPLHVNVDEDNAALVEMLLGKGFEIEVVGESFRVRFADALRLVSRAWVPTGFELLCAADVDEDRLFALDNAIRDLVPGTDGWRGDRDMFHEELTDAPPFDPDGYLVAVDKRTGRYVGLVRFWRNPTGPRLGLLGVLPEFRIPSLAAGLLEAGLTGAAVWGSDTFVTETSLQNAHIHPRLSRLAEKSLGRHLQMRLNQG